LRPLPELAVGGRGSLRLEVLKGLKLADFRVLIAGGGTGGHIIPALAVARELVARYHAEVLFVGTPRGLEGKLVPAAGFPLQLIRIGPLNAVPLMTRLKTLADLPGALLSCRGIIRAFNPGVVFGVGGYASGPIMATALLMKLPTMAFEPNAMPGLVNRWVGKRVDAAAVNFTAAASWFANCEVTGIPVRPAFFSLAQPDPARPHLLVFGGSQGARILNLNLPRVAARLLEAVPNLTILHQSGMRHVETTEQAYRASGADPARWQVQPFIDDMPASFGRASLVMARSGASTVAELAAAGKPSLLVPFAAAADGHQKKNAEAMASAGAAVMLEEYLVGAEAAQQERLLAELTGLLADPERLARMSAAARTQAHPDAAERIACRLVELAGR
jgi:UDP-N-acetylglucosamine--N-acetylmuramyl-(pentapeptide) pyrophosphoryl-undecaprenol N-acetylglucosamine transferase